MELLRCADDCIRFSDGIKTFEFFNLAIHNYYEVSDKKHCWRLCNYKKMVNDNLQLLMYTAFNKNGSYNFISFGYFTNDLVRRTIKLDEKGFVKEDYIYLFNPLNIHDTNQYNAIVPSDVSLEKYLCGKKRMYYTYNKKSSLLNNILPDYIVKEFLQLNELYSKQLDEAKGNIKLIREIIGQKDDEIPFSQIDLNMKRVLDRK